jgi:hypothetical protein
MISMLVFLFPGSALADYRVEDVTILQIDSFDGGNHLWAKVSGTNTCPIPHPYFIIRRWDDQTEPVKTKRQIMYQMALSAFMAGKKVRAIGTSCYNDRYLYADQIHIY